jgi:hypothetical protein
LGRALAMSLRGRAAAMAIENQTAKPLKRQQANRAVKPPITQIKKVFLVLFLQKKNALLSSN